MKNTKTRFLSAVLTLSVASQLVFVHALTVSAANTLVNSSLTAHRISGVNRYATADALAEKFKSSGTVIITSGDNFPDALSSAPLAKKYNAPILLSSSSGLSASSLDEIVRLKATKAIIVGGTGSVPQCTDSQLTAIGISPTRLSGKDRYATSLLVAKQLSNITSAAIVSGEDFPDALSISAIASQLGMPIILSSRSGLSPEALNFIKSCKPAKTYIIGTRGMLSDTIAQSVPGAVVLEGSDKYDTDLKVLSEFAAKLNFDNVYLTTGEGFADALAGSVVAANTASPVILIGSSIDSSLNTYLMGHITLNTKIIALGGPSVISDDIIAKLMNSKASLLSAKIYSHSGTYSGDNIMGSAVINAPDVNLKDTTINGNLLISSTAADGNIDLNNVKVNGNVIVNGSGTILIHNMTLPYLDIDNPSGNDVSVITDATSAVTDITVDSDSIIDASITSKAGKVLVNNGSKATLKGSFAVINVAGVNSYIDATKAVIDAISINSTGINSTIETSASTKFATLNIYAKTTITGGAAISNANIYANGSAIGSEPKIIKLDKNITSTICGKTVSTSTVIPVIDKSKLDTSTLKENIKAAQSLINKASSYSSNPSISSALSASVARLKYDIQWGSNLTYDLPMETQEQAQAQTYSAAAALAQDILNFNITLTNALNQQSK